MHWNLTILTGSWLYCFAVYNIVCTHPPAARQAAGWILATLKVISFSVFLEIVCKIFNLIFEKWLWPRTVCRTSHRKRQPLKDWEKVELSKRDLLMSFCWIFLLSCLILSRWIINGNGYFTLSSYLTKQINYGTTSLLWAFFIKHLPSFPSISTWSSVKRSCGISPVTSGRDNLNSLKYCQKFKVDFSPDPGIPGVWSMGLSLSRDSLTDHKKCSCQLCSSGI